MSFKIHVLKTGQMAANCYLLSDIKTNKGVIVDPGDSGEYIISKLTDLNTRPVAVIATHGHFDHTSAALELCLAFDIPFMMNKKDSFLLNRQKKSAKFFTGAEVDPAPEINKSLEDGEYIKFGKSSLKIRSLPGHTPGSICLYSKKQKEVFVGDILFADGQIGRSDFNYSDKIRLVNSIGKIKANFKGFVAYPGHGKSFVVESVH